MRRVRLATRLLLTTALSCVVPLVALAWFLINGYAKAAEETVRTRLIFVADATAALLERQLIELEGPLTSIAVLLGRSTQGVATLRDVIAATDALDAVAIYDDEGKLVDVIQKGERASTFAERLAPAVLADVRESRRHLGELTVSDDGPALALVVAAPGAHATWYVATKVATRQLSDAVYALAAGTLLDFEAQPELARSLLVLDQHRRVIAHVDPELVETGAELHAEPILAQLGLEPSTRDGFVVSTDVVIDGAPWFGVVKTVKGLPFVIVAQTPRALALRDFARARTTAMVAVAVIVALALLLTLRFAHHIAGALGKLAAYAGALAERRFDDRLVIHTGDELEVVGDAMTKAAADLKASEAELGRQATIRADLSRYLSSQLVERVIRREQTMTLGGTRRTVSVLFADVAGFTALAQHHPPEQVVALLNQLFTMLTQLIFRYGGTVDKFIGDCVMAFWNAPDDQPNHATLALSAAVDIRIWLDSCNEVWRREFGVTLQLAIGVHTGEALVGNLGSASRMEYTCVGDAVNLAARLESIARPLQILTSRDTLDAAGGGFMNRDLGPQRLAGRLQAVDVYELIV